MNEIEQQIYQGNERKRKVLSRIIKRGLLRPFTDEQIFQYQGLLEELELRKTLHRYLEDLPITEENKDTLRRYAEEVGLDFNEYGYYAECRWGSGYYLNCPFTREEELVLRRLAAEQMRNDFEKKMLEYGPIKIKYLIVS